MESLQKVYTYITTFDYEPRVTPLSSVYAPFIGMIFYLAMVYSLSRWMKGRRAFSLDLPLAIHNVFLSLFSLVMFLGMVIPVAVAIFKHGFLTAICDSENRIQVGTQVFMTWMFYVSKYYEFLDTVFIILKKKPLIFLHVYHHAATVFFVWIVLDHNLTILYFDGSANCLVHVVMYYYYFVSGWKHQYPWWKKYITSMQIVQFMLDIIAHYSWYYYHSFTPNCHGSLTALHFSNAIVLSFLLLFIKFYRDTYKKKGGKDM